MCIYYIAKVVHVLVWFGSDTLYYVSFKCNEQFGCPSFHQLTPYVFVCTGLKFGVKFHKTAGLRSSKLFTGPGFISQDQNIRLSKLFLFWTSTRRRFISFVSWVGIFWYSIELYVPWQTQSQHLNIRSFCGRYFTVRCYYLIEKHKTAGHVRSWVYWPGAKITGLGPAVQCQIRALL